MYYGGKIEQVGLIYSGTGEATLENFTASELSGLLKNFVHGWLVKQVVVVEPCNWISNNRINAIYMASLFQGTNPPIVHIISLSASANLDPPQINFQLNGQE